MNRFLLRLATPDPQHTHTRKAERQGPGLCTDCSMSLFLWTVAVCSVAVLVVASREVFRTCGHRQRYSLRDQYEYDYATLRAMDDAGTLLITLKQ